MDSFFTTPKITADRIREYLEQGKRFDGRKPFEFRDIIIEDKVSKNAESSVRIKIGKTEVLVGVKMDITEPYPDSPSSGNLMVTAELSPISSPRFENGPPKFPAIELGRVTDRGLRESKFIEFDKLCIKEGEKVWNIFVDIYPINDDGNLMDAAAIGAVIALKNAEIPKYDEKEGKVLFGESSGKKLPISEGIIPISKTIHKIGNNFIVDPTREEEDISEARVTISGSNGTIFSIQKGEGKELLIDEFERILDSIDEVDKDILKKIKEHIK